VTKPLEQITVIELAGLGALPFAGMILAGMGADVLLVDRPSGPLAPDAMSGAVSRGKRSIVVDLKHRDAAAVMLRIVESADVLMEGFRPGVVERLGIGPDQCFAVNPELVYGRMTGWGRQGPYASMAGHDINYIALSGTLAAIGRHGQPPTPPLNLVGDFGGGGMLMAIGVLCALLECTKSGKGQVVDAAMVDGAALLTTFIYGLRAMGVWHDGRGTNLLDTGAHFYEVYETSDGKYVSLGSIEPQFCAELLRLTGLGKEELPHQMDRDAWPEQKERMAKLFKTKTRDEWSDWFDGRDICYGPVNDLQEALEDPQLLHREMVLTDDRGWRHLGIPIKFQDEPGRVDFECPGHGAQTEEIIARLGYAADAIKVLREKGVC